jgi:hypothetical protein
MGAAVGARASAAHSVTPSTAAGKEAREVVRQAEPVETGALDAGRGAEAISRRGNASRSAIVSAFLLELYRSCANMRGLFPVIVFTGPRILGNLFIGGWP